MANKKYKPGIIIHGSDGKGSQDLLALLKSIRTLMRCEVEEASELAKDIPIHISFHQIMQGQNDEWIAEKAKDADTPFSLEEAILRAMQECNTLNGLGIKAEVVTEEYDGDTDVSKIKKWIEMGYTIGLYGGTGNGKTSKAREACRMAGLKLDQDAGEVVYFSVPTLNPEDIVGIPYPQGDGTHFKYLTMPTIVSAKVVILDEFTRPSHPKVHNALMQLMIEHRINDTYYPNLQSVICMWNPADDDAYSGVDEIDKAVIERIDKFMEVVASPNAEIIAAETGCAIEVSEAAVRFWESLSDPLKDELNPRRLAKICKSWHNGDDISDSVIRHGIHKMTVDLTMLKATLSKLDVLTLETLMQKKDDPAFIEEFKSISPKGTELRNRFMQLVWTMKDRVMHEEMHACRHLWKYVHKDQIPTIDGNNKSLYAFVVRSARKAGLKDQEEMVKFLADKQASVSVVKQELSDGVEAFIRGKENTSVV